jgi:hypothetical protein
VTDQPTTCTTCGAAVTRRTYQPVDEPHPFGDTGEVKTGIAINEPCGHWSGARTGQRVEPSTFPAMFGPHQPDASGARAAQIQAVRDVTAWAEMDDQLASEVVDAVHAAGRDQGDARSYQQAVANARNNDLYRTWWRTTGIDWDEDDWLNQPARRALARYLEAVGPGGTGSERNHPGDAISASAHAHHRYAVAFHTLSAELSKAGRFVALSEREAAARAMLAAVDNLDRAWGRDNPATAAETGQDGTGVSGGCEAAETGGSEP